jgi:hypothetical protein
MTYDSEITWQSSVPISRLFDHRAFARLLTDSGKHPPILYHYTNDAGLNGIVNPPPPSAPCVAPMDTPSAPTKSLLVTSPASVTTAADTPPGTAEHARRGVRAAAQYCTCLAGLAVVRISSGRE